MEWRRHAYSSSLGACYDRVLSQTEVDLKKFCVCEPFSSSKTLRRKRATPNSCNLAASCMSLSRAGSASSSSTLRATQAHGGGVDRVCGLRRRRVQQGGLRRGVRKAPYAPTAWSRSINARCIGRMAVAPEHTLALGSGACGAALGKRRLICARAVGSAGDVRRGF